MSAISLSRNEPDIAQWVREDFCHSFCYRVTDPQLRDAFSATVNELYGVAMTQQHGNRQSRHSGHGSSRESPRGPRAVAEEPRFPGSVPCSIMRADLDLLRTRHYVAFEKTDGTRYLLLCTMVNNVSFCVLVDRHWTARIIRLQFEPDVFERNTMFDGELVQNMHTGQWHFLVFDLVSSGELSTRQHNYVLRMNAANHIIRTEFRPDASRDAFLLQVKRYEKMEDIERLRHADKEYKGFATDGYLFMPVNNYVAPFRNRAILKWKSKHTIDFELRYKSGIGLEYYLKDEHDVPKYFGPVPPPTSPTAPTEHRQILTECLERIRAGERVIVECDYDSAESMWFVIKERVDRQGANAEYTVERTLDNLRENITKDELFHVINNERVARRPLNSGNGGSNNDTNSNSSSRGRGERDRNDYHQRDSQMRQQQQQQQTHLYQNPLQQPSQRLQPQQQFEPRPPVVEHWKQQPYYVNYCAPGTSFPVPPNVVSSSFFRQPQPTYSQQHEERTDRRFQNSSGGNGDAYGHREYERSTCDYSRSSQEPFVSSRSTQEPFIASTGTASSIFYSDEEKQLQARSQIVSSTPLPLLKKIEPDYFVQDPLLQQADSLDYAAPPAHFLPNSVYDDTVGERDAKKRKTTAMEYDPLRPSYGGQRVSAPNKIEIIRPILVEDNSGITPKAEQPLDLQAALEQLSSVLKANPNGLLAQTILKK